MPSALWASAIREREVVRSHASYITSCAFAVALSPRRPAIAARKLSIARLSGNTAGTPAFRGFEGTFRARLFESGIPCSSTSSRFRVTPELWADHPMLGGSPRLDETRDVFIFATPDRGRSSLRSG